MMWRRSDRDVPRALPRQIGMPRLHFGMIPGTKPEPLKTPKTEQRARSFAGRDPDHLLAFEMRCSETREYPSLIDTFFVTHTVNGVFIRDEDRAIYEEMVRWGCRLQHRVGCALPDERSMPCSKGQQGVTFPVVGMVLTVTGQSMFLSTAPNPPAAYQCPQTRDVRKAGKKKNKYLTKQAKLVDEAF
ncbi:hypothetical protein Tco_0683566 [Tanacetum coccineum]